MTQVEYPAPMSALTRHTCVVLCLVGSLLLMAGLTLAMATALLGIPAGWPKLATAAGGLILGGLCCGALITVLIAAARRGRSPTVGSRPGMRKPARGAARRADPATKPVDPYSGPGRAGPPWEQDDPFALPGVRWKS
ncbi:MAG TPA: hypothetical protein VGS19_02235 [Streptosporangiaceae bacterium]|nr:hypothetical protein [Streptosporangiaceae bacterium]